MELNRCRWNLLEMAAKKGTSVAGGAEEMAVKKGTT